MGIFLIIASIIIVAFTIGAVFGAPWVPAFQRDLEAVLDDAKLQRGQVFYELGCGEGRLLVAAAKRGAIVVGYEINPLLWVVARVRTWRQPNVKVILGDFWRVDLSNVDLALAFLVPRYMDRLEKKLAAEMKPGSKFVSYIFDMPHKKPAIKRHHWQVYEY